MLGCGARGGTAPAPARTEAAITPADVRARIYLIADDSMRGRQAGSAGNFIVANYLAAEAARIGLEPAGENGTYFQTVPMVRRAVDSTSWLAVDADSLKPFTDFAPMLVLNAVVGANGRPTGIYSAVASAAAVRFPSAAAIAIAALDYLTPAASNSMRARSVALAAQPDTMRPPPAGILLSQRAASKLLGRPLDSLRTGALGRPVRGRVGYLDRPVEAAGRNVVAILRGSDPGLRGEMVAIGAHSDHLGPASVAVDHDSLRAFNRVMRPEGAQSTTVAPTAEQSVRIRAIVDSLRRIRPPRADSIFNGADDDGSGSVAALEVAESLASGPRPRRSILFVWHTGEEAGLLGSGWFTDHPTVPRDSIIAQLNMDMVGRGTAEDVPRGGPRNLQLIGARRRSTELGATIDSVNAARVEPYVIDYSFDTPGHPLNRYCRSDHFMYARYGIPIAFFSRGYHIDYHTVTDEPQYIQYADLARVAGFVRDVAVALANRNTPLVLDKPKLDPRVPCKQ